MLLIELALLPAIVLVLWIYRQDRIEKEPKGLLLFFVFVIALDIWAYKFVKKQARGDRTLAA